MANVLFGVSGMNMDQTNLQVWLPDNGLCAVDSESTSFDLQLMAVPLPTGSKSGAPEAYTEMLFANAEQDEYIARLETRIHNLLMDQKQTRNEHKQAMQDLKAEHAEKIKSAQSSSNRLNAELKRDVTATEATISALQATERKLRMQIASLLSSNRMLTADVQKSQTAISVDKKSIESLNEQADKLCLMLDDKANDLTKAQLELKNVHAEFTALQTYMSMDDVQVSRMCQTCKKMKNVDYRKGILPYSGKDYKCNPCFHKKNS